MIIYLGADHRGFDLKDSVKSYLISKGYEVSDVSQDKPSDEDDFVDSAIPVSKEISLDPERKRGILICGSGVGMAIAANKFGRVRAAVCLTPDYAYDARHDDDINLLCLSADATSLDVANKIVDVFLATPADVAEKYRRRIGKIIQLENDHDITGR